MSENIQTPEGQVASTVTGEQAQAGTEQPSPQQSQYLTLEDAAKLKQDILNEARSYSDKGRVALKKQMDAVEATIKTAEQFGKPFSEQDKNDLRQKARIAAEIDPTASETATAPVQTEEQAQQAARDLYAHDLKQQGRFGFELEPTDPEMKLLTIIGNPDADKATIERAFQAKKDRLSSTPQTTEAPTNAGVRVGVTPQSAPVTIKTGKGYLEEAFK
jgi:hypothetical protein